MADSPRQRIHADCPKCGEGTLLSAEVLTVIVESPLLDRPYLLIPDDGYRVCTNKDCTSINIFTKKAIDSHPATRTSLDCWVKAVIYFCDLSYATIYPETSSLGLA